MALSPLKKILLSVTLISAACTTPFISEAQDRQLVFLDGFEGSQTYFQQAGVQGCGSWGLLSDDGSEGTRCMAYAASLLKANCYADMYAGPIEIQNPSKSDSLEFTFAIKRQPQKGDETLLVYFLDGNGKPAGKTLAILAYYRGQPTADKTGWEYHTLMINAQALGTGAKVPFYVYIRGTTGTNPKNFIDIDDTQLYYIDYEDASSAVAEPQDRVAPEVTLYPNPSANGNFSLRFSQALNSTASLQITDLQGRLVYSEQISAHSQPFTYSLDLAGQLSQGMYAVSITTANGVTNKMLVVE